MLEAITGFLGTWGLLGVLVGLQLFLPTSIIIAYGMVKSWLDRKHPDDLPLGTGQWVARQVERPEYAVRLANVEVVVSPTKEKGADVFWPAANVIKLKQETYGKNDPFFWAIGAHELGHVWVYRSSAAVAALFLMCRAGMQSLTRLGTALVLANILYGSAAINRFALWAIAVGVGMNVVVLIDEAAASTVGLRMLRRDPHLGATQWRAALASLVTALLTYLGAFAGRAILLLEWPLVAELVERRTFVPGEPLQGWWVVLVAVLSVLLLAPPVWGIRRMAKAHRVGSLRDIKVRRVAEVIESLLQGLVVLGLLWLVWDQPLGTAFQFCCVLALLAAHSVIRLILAPVGFVVAMILLMVILPIVIGVLVVSDKLGRGPSEQPAQAADPPEPSGMVNPLENLAKLEQALIRSVRNQPWYLRLGPLALGWAHVPLLVAFWLS